METLTIVRKIFIILLIAFILLFSLSAPYSTRDIDKLAYVIALGLDVGTDNNLMLSVQLSKPENSSSGSSGGSYTNIVNTIECSSINAGISIFNSYLSRRINLSHCKVLVMSEELAARGVSDYIYTLLNNVEMNAHASVLISKTTAKEFLNAVEPELEDLISKYYEVSFASTEYTGYTQNVSLIKFFSACTDTFVEPVAILGSIGDMSIISANKVENLGIAVFKSDKLIGELNAQENIWHAIVSNTLKSCTISIPDPIGDTKSIDINLKLKNNSKNKVTFINGTPHISCKISVKAQILSATEESTLSNTNYYTKENAKLIEEACNEYLQKNIYDYLYKTSKDFNADIDSFGKYAVKYFSTIQKWEEYDWLSNYKNSIFNVEVSTNLKSGYSFL